MADRCLETWAELSSLRIAAGAGRHSWLSGQLHQLADRARRWMRRDQGLRALAEVDDDHVSDLSEIGRRVRREERRRALPPPR
jgi:uncharacterized protein YjiS (DUF1127 family)